MIPHYKPRSFQLRGYTFWCSPNKYNVYDAKYLLFFCNKGSAQYIGYADTVAEAKKRARQFLNYYFM